MAFIRVPEIGFRGMLELSTWTEEQFSGFVNAIENSPIQVPMQPALVESAKRFTDASNETAAAVASMVQSVIATKKNFSGSNDDYVNELLASAAAPRADKKNLLKEQIDVLSGRLQRLFAIEKLTISSKATELLFDREKIVSDFVVISDARPVFNLDGDLSLNSMLILHSLRVSYISDGESKEFFLALDDSDLSKLIEVSQRALAKGRALAEKFSTGGIDVIQVRGGE